MFLDSLNMKTTELTFSGLVKNYTVKDRTTLSPGSLNIGERTCQRWVIPSICYPPQAPQKQRGTVNHDGEKWRKWVSFCVKILAYRWQLSVVALEHGTCLHRVSRLGNPFVSLSHRHHLSHHTPLSHSENTSVIVILWVGFSCPRRVKCCQVKCSREVSQESCLSYCVSPVTTLFCSTISQFVIVSCRWWGIHHGPPSTGLFLSTPTHHPGRIFRNLSVP